jgi:hypothetical protein
MPCASSEEVRKFVANSGRTKVALEPLFGFTKTAGGKNLRRWELYGAPPTISILMAYMTKYGFDVAEAMTKAAASLP